MTPERSSPRRRWLGVLGGLAGLLLFGGACLAIAQPEAVRLLAMGDSRELPPADAAVPAHPAEPQLLIVALDGVDRELLYGLLRSGQMPRTSELVGGDGREFPHAYFDETLLSTLPSSTLAAWATVFTGEPPSVHGVAGNEYFVRETRSLAAPAPVSVNDPAPVLATYTKDYANDLLSVPTIYERMRQERPDISIWVSMSQFHRGADRLLTADRTVIANGFGALLASAVGDPGPRGVYAQLDGEVIDTVIDALKEHAAPHVLTVYLTGTDHYAHGADDGPDPARTAYLKEVVDPLLGKLKDALAEHDAVANRSVVLVSDHGHTEVLHDEEHALSTDADGDPPSVLRAAGFRVRPFELETADDADFQSVLAYGGAMAYVYVADRSTCLQEKTPCDWRRPARYREDVLAAAEAFYRASEGAPRAGVAPPKMRGTLDLVLTRKPVPFAEDDRPFEVYVGDGRTVPLQTYLARHPHPTYVALERRLLELAAGPRGERAGDVLLLAHNGDRDEPAQRFYFASLYRSWHGSPSKKDSEVPLVVAHPQKTTKELAAWVGKALGDSPRQQALGRIFLEAVRPSPTRGTPTRAIKPP